MSDTPTPPPAAVSETTPPEYLPARMLNEFVYCPRLFYLEWVEGLFEESVDTVEGKGTHRRVDRKRDPLVEPDQTEAVDGMRSRSVLLSSDLHGLIARIDIVELADGVATPVDYKRGAPPPGKAVLEAWDADRVQIAAQAIILRENGYRCDEGIVYYAATKQRVRVPIDDALVEETLAAAQAARETATRPCAPPHSRTAPSARVAPSWGSACRTRPPCWGCVGVTPLGTLQVTPALAGRNHRPTLRVRREAQVSGDSSPPVVIGGRST